MRRLVNRPAADLDSLGAAVPPRLGEVAGIAAPLRPPPAAMLVRPHQKDLLAAHTFASPIDPHQFISAARPPAAVRPHLPALRPQHAVQPPDVLPQIAVAPF